MANEKETRYSDFGGLKVEVRNEGEAEEMVLEGYPIVFEQETLIGSEDYGYYEVIDRNAFNNCDMNDVCCRYNHLDGFLILARTRNKSLELTRDEHGIYMKATLIPTSTNKDIYLMAKSGLLSQGSFAFTVRGEECNNMKNGKYVRRITDISKLFDCSIVDTPAYQGTEIYARSLEETMKKFKSEEHKKPELPKDVQQLIWMYK